jgi:hypothetical protein
MKRTLTLHTLEVGKRYTIDWQARDIGYGVEEGSDEYTFGGITGTGSGRFDPTDGGATVYLFADELLGIWVTA